MRYRTLDGGVRLLGTGAALPGPAVGTAAVAEFVRQLHGDRVARRFRAVARQLGIEARHLCRDLVETADGPRPGDANPDLCAAALRQALAAAGRRAGELGYLIGHTATPHTVLPPNIAWVADRLGYDGPYGELRQACTGFANALHLVAGLIARPQDRPVAVVGSETGSVHFDPHAVAADPDQLVNMAQMGDGAGAAVLGPDDGRPGPRITAAFYGSLGHGLPPGLAVTRGGSARPRVGAGVVRFEHDYAAIRETGPKLFAAGLCAAREAGVNPGAVEWVLPHQANGRLADLLPTLGVPGHKVVVTADRLGNLGSAAIWVSLHQIRTAGRLRPGDRVLVLGAESTKYMFGGFVYTH